MPEFNHIKDMGDEDVVEKVTADFKQAYSDKSKSNTRCRRYTKIFEALDHPDDIIDETSGELTDDRRIYSRTYMPLGAAIAETSATMIYNALFSTPDYLEVTANSRFDDLATQKITAHLMRRHQENKFKHFVYRALQMAVCYDYCVTMTKWEIQPGHIPTRVEKETPVQLGRLTVPKREIVMEEKWVPDKIDRHTNVVLDYFNCWHDKASTDGFKESSFFIDTRWEPFENLWAMRQSDDNPHGIYVNLDYVKSYIEEMLKSTPNAESTTPSGDDIESMIKRMRVKVIRYWTHHHYVEMVGDKLISRTDIGGMPLTLWRVGLKNAKFDGIGMIQRIERNQYDINAIVNLKRDFQNLMLNPVAIVDEELASINDNKVELYPGRTLLSPSGRPPKDLIYFFQPGIDMSQGSTEELALQMDSMKDVSKISENQLGNFAKGRKTARESSAVAAGAGSHSLRQAEAIEDNCLEPIYQQQFLLEQRFMTKEDQFKYLGAEAEEWVVVTPEDYKWSALPNFVCKGSGVAGDREIRTQQFLAAFDRALQFPEQHDLQAIFKEMWRLLSPRDYHKFVKDPQFDKLPNIPPDYENQIMAQGQWVEASPQNKHGEHRASHQAFMRSDVFRSLPARMQNIFKEHLGMHDEIEQAMASQAAAQGNSMPPGGAADVSRGIRGAGQGAAYGAADNI
jgi:hypothetical protein